MGSCHRSIEAWLEKERDQLALWIPVALGAGIAAWFTLPTPGQWLLFLALSAGGGMVAFSVGHGGRAARMLALAGLLAAAGCALAWTRSERVAAPRLLRPIVATGSGIVEEVRGMPAEGKVRLLLAVDPDPAGLLPRRVRINAAEGDVPADLRAGSRIAFRARLMPPPGPSIPGGYDFARVAWFAGIGAIGKALGPVTLLSEPDGGGWWRWLADRRRDLTAHIERRLPGSAGGIAAAFVTGDTGAITLEDGDAMRRAGLAHLLSISGLHISVVVAGTMLVTLRLLALSPFLALRLPLPAVAAGAGALAGIAYTLLSGAEVPTVRSCVAALLVLLGTMLGRDALTLRLVAAGALIVLVFRPEAVVGPSFQLSFAAVAVIVVFHDLPRVREHTRKRDEAFHRRMLREGASLLVTGLLVEAALAPIAAWHFHRAGLYGAAANIVAIPFSTFVIMPAEALALFLDPFGLSGPVWAIVGKAMAFLLGLARLVSSLPGSVAAVPAMPGWAFGTMIAGGLWLTLWRTGGRFLGVVPLLVGLLGALAAGAPDLLITGDGRNVGLLAPNGTLHLLRDRTGDYTRQQLAEGAGTISADAVFDDLAGGRCNQDLCAVTVPKRARSWTILATRSAYLIDRDRLAVACARADIVVSDRKLPPGCRPRWFVADRRALATTGGMAVWLDPPAVREVIGIDRHPWQSSLSRQMTGRPAHASHSPHAIAGEANTPLKAARQNDRQGEESTRPPYR